MTNPYSEQMADRRDPQREQRATLHFFVVLTAVVLCFLILFTQILIGVRVYGKSMEPTLYHGDYLFIDTTASVQRGDIIVLKANLHPETGDADDYTLIIKRVIGLPGDSLYAENGVLYRKEAGQDSFRVVEEPYLGEEWSEDISLITVEAGEVYFLGDHRSVSDDSRALGPLPLANVVGVVTKWSLASKEFLTGLFGFFARNKA